jgi:ParB family chromosome partitioning protein
VETREPQRGAFKDLQNPSAEAAGRFNVHRTAALSTRPDVALAAITHHLALRALYDVPGYEMPSALALTPDPEACSLMVQAPDLPESRGQRTLDQGHAEWHARLPRKPDGLWKWLLKQEQPVALALLSYCVGQTVYVVRAPHAQTPAARLQAADQLAKALTST